MAREIKFRIIYKDKVNGYEKLVEFGGVIEWQWMALDLNPDKGERWSRGVFPHGYKYIRNQFTGLLDKNRKEIYDGDILGSEGRVIGHVEGDVRGYCYDVVYLKPVGDKAWSLYAVVTTDYPDGIEVIGNIYENPDLISEKVS